MSVELSRSAESEADFLPNSSDGSPAEFLSRCWVPIIHLESRFMFAYGNTLMEDFLEDLEVSDEMDILMLGVGDIRYMLKTVAGLETRPEAAGCPSSLGYDSFYALPVYVSVAFLFFFLCMSGFTSASLSMSSYRHNNISSSSSGVKVRGNAGPLRSPHLISSLYSSPTSCY